LRRLRLRLLSFSSVLQYNLLYSSSSIKHRIDCKIEIANNPTSPSVPYFLFFPTLHACHSTRSLRLSNTNLLFAPFVRTLFGARSFSGTVPKNWNSLPQSPRIPVPVLLPSVVTSRPTTVSRPSIGVNAAGVAGVATPNI